MDTPSLLNAAGLVVALGRLFVGREGLLADGLLDRALGGLIEGGADRVAKRVFAQVLESMSGRRLPLNSDLVRAAEKARAKAEMLLGEECLESLGSTMAHASERSWLKARLGLLRARLDELAKSPEIAPPPEMFGELMAMLSPDPSRAERVTLESAEAKFLTALTADVDTPRIFVQAMRLRFLPMVSACFAESLKDDVRVRTVFQVELGRLTKVGIDELMLGQERTDALIREIGRNLERAFHDNQQSLSEQLSEVHTQLIAVRTMLAGLKELEVVEAAMQDKFGGRVLRLTPALLARKASDERSRQFLLTNAPLDWDIIAASADIRRDQQAAMLEAILRPSEAARIFCICGPPLTGKSTLAWRLAAEVHATSGAPLFQILDPDDPAIWWWLPLLQQRLRTRIYVLADDPFREDRVKDAIAKLPSDSLVTVIATAQSNERIGRRTRAELIQVDVIELSPRERVEIARALGAGPKAVERANSRELAGTTVLEFMSAISEVQVSRESLEESLRRLRLREPVLARAVGLTAFAGAMGLTVPEELLSRVTEWALPEDYLEHRELQGLLFRFRIPGFVTTGHMVRASFIHEYFARTEPRERLLKAFLRGADLNTRRDRRFVCHLLRRMRSYRPDDLVALADAVSAFVDQAVEHADMSELLLWSDYHRGAGNHQSADACASRARQSELSDAADCAALLILADDDQDFLAAIQRVEGFVRDHPSDHEALAAYLRHLPRAGAEAVASKGLAEPPRLFELGPEADSLRCEYMNLMRLHGADGACAALIDRVATWLDQNPTARTVFAAYLVLVAQRGTSTQVMEGFTRATSWLSDFGSSEESFVRQQLVALGNQRPMEQSPDWRSFQRVMGDWLCEHPEAHSVWGGVMRLLRRFRRYEELDEITSRAVARNPDDSNMEEHRIKYLEQCAEPEAVTLAYREAMNRFPHAIRLVQMYASWLRDSGEHKESLEVYTSLLRGPHAGELPPSELHCGIGRLFVRMNQIDRAEHHFREALRHHDKNILAWDGMARVARERGDLETAERLTKKAISLATRRRRQYPVLFTHLGWILLEAKRPEDALDPFERARLEDPWYFENYWGIAEIKALQKDWRGAHGALVAAQERMTRPLGNHPAVQRIPQLGAEIEARLGREIRGAD